MPSHYYVYSTLTSPQLYTSYTPGVEGGLPQVAYEVRIEGGSNVANKHFVTPRGVVTKITEEDYLHLQENSQFKRHEKNGFITVRNDNVDPEVAVAKGMNQKDDSAPVTPNDYPTQLGIKE